MADSCDFPDLISDRKPLSGAAAQVWGRYSVSVDVSEFIDQACMIIIVPGRFVIREKL